MTIEAIATLCRTKRRRNNAHCDRATGSAWVAVSNSPSADGMNALGPDAARRHLVPQVAVRASELFVGLHDNRIRGSSTP